MPFSGTYNNTPVVRFGNISMLPNEIIHNEYINMGNPGFLIDLRSRTGFSGSPAFIQFVNKTSTVGHQHSWPHSGEGLIGICWGGFVSPEKNNDYISNNNAVPNLPIYEALTCVIPYARIITLVMSHIHQQTSN